MDWAWVTGCRHFLIRFSSNSQSSTFHCERVILEMRNAVRFFSLSHSTNGRKMWTRKHFLTAVVKLEICKAAKSEQQNVVMLLFSFSFCLLDRASFCSMTQWQRNNQWIMYGFVQLNTTSITQNRCKTKQKR